MAGGGCIPLNLPPGSAPGHKLRKPSKELAYQYFSHLDPLIQCSFFTKKQSKKGDRGWGHGTMPSFINNAPDEKEEHYCNELKVP